MSLRSSWSDGFGALVFGGLLALFAAVLPSATQGPPAAGSASPPTLSFIAGEARKAYDAGRFEEALHLYGTYAASGGEGAEVRHNMGNCALRAGDLGRAVLEYRRALRLDPEMEAARHDLEVVRALIPARKSPWQPPPWEAFLEGIPLWTLQGMVLALAAFANLAFCAALFLGSGRPRRALAASVVILLTAGAVVGGMLMYAGSVLPQRRPSVVVREAPVFGGPAAEGVPVDRLPPGSEVMLLKQAGDWRLVLWGDGRGWVPAATVEAP